MHDRPTFGSLFAGIGGIDLGLERAGWECRFQVEWDAYCQRVLAKHWPDVPRFGDIHDVHGVGACPSLADSYKRHVAADEAVRAGWDGAGDGGPVGCPNCLPPVDLLAGGFPCQPFSVAGKQRRLDDDRWLWPEFARTIRELRPRYVLVENVPGLLVGGGMDAVLGDLAELGYDTEWESIPAAAVGAPHLRYRVWIIASRTDAHGEREQRRERSGRTWDGRAGPEDGGPAMADSNGAPSQGGSLPSGVHKEHSDPDGRGSDAERLLADAAGGRQPRPRQLLDAIDTTEGAPWKAAQLVDGGFADQWSVEPDVGRVAHGVPARVDRLRALGNAVVPQVVEWIGRRILEAEAEVAA